jgi:UDP-N-acetylmuramyl pentapeptide phosphotransferase/UDP-N-acetylglucosamine-1-phosphate transferase
VSKKTVFLPKVTNQTRMMTVLTIGFVFLFSFFSTFLIRKIAIHKSIMDIPNDRSSHSIPTPRGGGLALAISWFLGITVAYLSNKISSDFFFAMLSGIPLTLTGFLDDIFNLSPKVRFMVQFLCAVLAVYFLNGLQVINLGFFSVNSTLILSSAAVLAIVWSTNLFNFLDGIDGYIGSESIFLGVSIYLLTSDKIGLIVAASALGFLLWNWQKAKIFMGDVGSTLLGFTFAVWAIFHQNTNQLSLPVWLILTSVFWFDASVTLFRRFLNREKLSNAHRKHAYQRIVQYGFSHQKTTLWALAINLTGLGLAWLANIYKPFSLIFLFIDLVILYACLGYVDRKKAFEKNIV